MKVVKTISKMYGGFLPITKRIIKYGLIFIISVYTIAVITYLLAGIKIDYYTAMVYARSLVNSACKCVAVLALAVVMFEAAANKSPTTEL